MLAQSLSCKHSPLSEPCSSKWMLEVTPTRPGIPSPPPATSRALQAGQALGVRAQGHGVWLGCSEQRWEHLWQEAASGASPMQRTP